MIVYALIDILTYLMNIVIIVVIVQFVLGLLISFNVVNMHNDAVAAVWKAVNAILDPVLRPIRRILPDTGMIDLSPMVLIIALSILIRIVSVIPYYTG
ncbi:MAG TPA: YggT family protein [Novosphingobium sp.]|nr:YggT family protein [Novosphingobium sp.]